MNMDYLVELLNQAQSILDGGFNVEAFLAWKSFAFFFVVALLGPSHYYSKNFPSITSESSPKGLLAGKGLLIAVREELDRNPGKAKTRITGRHRKAVS
jgi:hypothetical protein